LDLEAEDPGPPLQGGEREPAGLCNDLLRAHSPGLPCALQASLRPETQPEERCTLPRGSKKRYVFSSTKISLSIIPPPVAPNPSATAGEKQIDLSNLFDAAWFPCKSYELIDLSTVFDALPLVVSPANT
jgi:hypothetical protein